MKKHLFCLLGASCGLSFAVSFYPIAGVTSDTTDTDFFDAVNLIEGPGTGFDSNEPHNRTSNSRWVTNAPNGSTGNDYFGPVPTPGPRLVFDLGESVLLNEISLWGYSAGNSALSVDLRFSDTPTFTGEPVSISDISEPVTPRQSFTFPAVTARYVELVPTDNHFGVDGAPGGDRVGLSEVAFAVPPDPDAAVSFYPISEVLTNTENFYAADNLIDGPGFGFQSLLPHTSIFTTAAASTWVTNNPNGAGDYYDNDTPNPVIIFDLGNEVPLSEINTWGYAAGNTNGAKDYTLRFATDAEGVENFGSSITYAPTFEAAFGPGDRDIEVFEETVVARYVEMTITDNWRGLQGALPGGDRVGLAEIAFPVFEGSLNPLLGIVSAGRLSNGNFSITFFSTPGESYGLERSVNGQTWDRLPISITGSSEEASIIEDTSPLTDGSPVVLYRVVRP